MKLIPLCNSDKSAMVDDDDFEKLSQYEWRLTKKGYVIRYERLKPEERFWSEKSKRNRVQRTVWLHHEVAGRTDGNDVDHKDRNKLNAQKNNLRHVSRRRNLDNTENKNQFGFKGIYNLSKDGKTRARPWQSSFSEKGMRIYLGTYATAEDAAAAYDAFCEARTGERFNFVENQLNSPQLHAGECPN